jgi:hypothetical protein
MGSAVDREMDVRTDIHNGCRWQSMELHAHDAVAVSSRHTACGVDQLDVDAVHAVVAMLQAKQQTPARIRCKFDIGRGPLTLEADVHVGFSSGASP